MPNLISHQIIPSGQSPTRRFTVYFTYSEHVRSFDGSQWSTISHAQYLDVLNKEIDKLLPEYPDHL